MSAYLMQEMAAHHQAELEVEARQARLVKEAKGARSGESHTDIVGAIKGILSFRGAALRPAVNGGH
jgi:hypothetical protein